MASVSVYHDIVQKAALKKGRALGLGNLKNGRQIDTGRSDSDPTRTHEVLDDFGNSFITLDKSKGKYVDSFGHPLIRGADDDQVASFREIRNLSSQTRQILDTHQKKKEKELIQRCERTQDPDDESGEDDGDYGPMPSFLR